MSDASAIIADNLARVRDRIANAATQAGRNIDDILLVGVSKYVEAEEAAALINAGCDCLGESRPQQLWNKADHELLGSARWHMIGHLQRNKVRRTLPLVDLIHSVDSFRLAQSIDKEAKAIRRRAKILLEVNCSGDESKDGLTSGEVGQLLPQLEPLEHLEVCGLMTMAAREGGKSVAASNFESLRELRDRLSKQFAGSFDLSHLSMGMSHDFEVAIREGATMVRVGSLLFEGLRN